MQREIALALIFLACAGCELNTQRTAQEMQGRPANWEFNQPRHSLDSTTWAPQGRYARQAVASNPFRALVSFFLAVRNPASAWQAVGPGRNLIEKKLWGNSNIIGARSASAHDDLGSAQLRRLNSFFDDTHAALGRDILARGHTRHRHVLMQGDSINSEVSPDSAISALTLDLERQAEILDTLTSVNDATLIDHAKPSKPYDIVSLGLIQAVNIDDATGDVSIEIELPIAAASAGAGDRLTEQCRSVLQEKFKWINTVNLNFSIERTSERVTDTMSLQTMVKEGAAEPATEMSPLQKLASTDPTVANASPDDGKSSADSTATSAKLPGVGAVGHIVAVASCKGGVGKSTTAVNLAYALSAAGKRVGIVDLDIFGSSLPTMVQPDGELVIENECMLPLESNGVKLMSMGFLNPGAMPLRGARVTPVVQQLVGRTVWGKLDYLIVDMPPGTGDVQLTLSQDYRVSAAVLVTTPQRLSFVDVVKGVEMFHKVGIPTVAVVENMNGLRLTRIAEEAEKLIEKHDLSNAAASDLRELLSMPQPIFGDSHVKQLKEMWGISASFSLPLLPDVAASADQGKPVVINAPESEAAAVYASLANAVDKEVSGLADLQLPALLYTEVEKRVMIGLPDGSMQYISPVELRKKCRSPLNTPDNLPADLHPLEFITMGNYAVSVMWSDGHQSLIPYTSFVQGYPA